ncbi:hypothetical protein AAC03nite_36680 [Alicyclobacillus acidoterrestris]|nr:hypothetical protein AAC03nite_36680 [Alicyclobacillus acidoterrestris]
METIVFLGCQRSGSSREAIQAAKDLGYHTVLLTDRKSFVEEARDFPDVDEMIYTDLAREAKVRGVVQSLRDNGRDIRAITSFVEPNVSRAARLHNQFCDGRLSADAMAVMEDKVKTRSALVGTPYNVRYLVYDGRRSIDQLVRRIGWYPVVMKRPGSAGSKDVIRAFSPQQCRHRIRQLTAKSPFGRILIEEYIRGPQYLVEVLVHRRTIHIVAIVEQHMLKHEGRMIVAGYAVLIRPPRELLDSLREAVKDVVMKLGFEHGPCHIELRRRGDAWKVIEINPRMSGSAMNRMIELAYGVNLAEQTLRLMVGQSIDLRGRTRQHVYTQFVTVNQTGILEAVEGRARAERVPGVRVVSIKPRKGDKVQRPKSMGHRYAYVIASDEDSLDFAREAAMRAAGYLHFTVRESGYAR